MKMLESADAKILYTYLASSIDPKDIYIQILFETGCRVSESLNLGPESLSLNNLTIKPLKRSNLRQVTISPNLTAKLGNLPPRWIKALGETVSTESLRRTLTRHFHKLTTNLLGKRSNLHTLRHTAFSRLYGETKDLMLVKQWAGHKSIQSTLVYMQLDQQKEANEAAAKLIANLS